jgi:AcrR family transcriptional regulator/DNA-binding MarR family transcriptional regulator
MAARPARKALRGPRPAARPWPTAASADLAREEARAEQVAEIQRSRLLAAAVAVIDERGYERTTVAHITARSRVSRRTFYELFTSREECLLAILRATVGAIASELDAAGLVGLGWRERMRGALAVILAFLDREPPLARVCVVQTLHGGPRVLELRERVLAQLVAAVDEGRGESARAGGCTPLTAEGAVGAAHAILYARLARRDAGLLTGLLGELTAIVVLPYLGAAAARHEQAKPGIVPVASTAGGRGASAHPSPAGDLLSGIAMRMTYRTARVLEGIARHPGCSNRGVADHAGIQDQGQVSKLLARLQRLGLIVNEGEGAHAKGEPNAWVLTERGEQLARSIRVHAASERHAA